jgi:hypothetical protein
MKTSALPNRADHSSMRWLSKIELGFSGISQLLLFETISSVNWHRTCQLVASLSFDRI